MNEVILKLNVTDLQTIDKALVELPYKEACGLINRINLQLHEQLTAKGDVDEPTNTENVD